MSLLLPFFQALKPPKGAVAGAHGMALPGTPSSLTHTLAEVADYLLTMLPLFSQTQPPCSGPLYEWMAAWPWPWMVHGSGGSGLAADGAVGHGAGGSGSSSGSSSC